MGKFDKDIRTPVDLQGFDKLGKFEVKMDIFEDEKYEKFYDLEKYTENKENYDAPPFKVGETVFVSAKLQNGGNRKTSNDNLNLKAFHCWIHNEADMCSKPHFSVIEDSCIEPFMAENGFKIWTENGNDGNNFNMSFPVFKLQKPKPRNADGSLALEEPAEKTFLTCDFEVCLGDCSEKCDGEWEA